MDAHVSNNLFRCNSHFYCYMIYRWAFYWPAIDAATKDFFGADTPSSSDLIRNTSLVIFNSHFSLNYPRPLVPAMIEAGGMQIKKTADPLTNVVQILLCAFWSII